MPPGPNPFADLRFALEPIVDLATEAVVAHELLAKPRAGGGYEGWARQHAGHDPRWVTEAALSALLALGPVVGPVHLNITALDLDRPGFAATVGALGARWQGRLVLEITEHHRLVDTPATRTNLALLRSWGARFAIDDFGEGWSNFSAVRLVQPEVLKVTRRILDDMRDAGLGRWIVAMAAGLGCDTSVVEQIESPEHLAAARAMGFDAAQGFWWGGRCDQSNPATAGRALTSP